MKKREVVRQVLEGRHPSYVPWHFSFTKEALDKLVEYYGTQDIHDATDDHIIELGSAIGFFEDIGNERLRDVFGVVWNRSVDKDIGIVEGNVITEPTLKNFKVPDPLDERFFQDIPSKIKKYSDCFRVYCLGFSLYERAWTLRGMENILMDFIINPQFIKDLLHTIADYNIAQIREALKYDIDAVYFGDDWGQQSGLIMGPGWWKEFLLPELKRMYDVVRKAGKFVMIHSCGNVSELFDDLINAGVNCFNPFQPEVMDVHFLLEKFRGRISFHGGLSTQRTLPFGSTEDVRRECNALLRRGSQGSYIIAPAHAVEGDVKLENMLAFITTVQSQEGYLNNKKIPQKIVSFSSEKKPIRNIFDKEIIN